MFEVMLRVDHKVFGVPYYRPPEDSNSASFIDLKKQPERISEIPELRDWTELRNVIRAANESSNFKTLGCAEFVYDQDSPQYMLLTYVDFCFAKPELNHDQPNFYDLFHRFTEYVETLTPPDNLVIKIELRRTDYYDENIAGWCMEYWVQGFGNTREEAREIPNVGLQILHDFLQVENSRLGAA
jgi:hypothetical protein